MRPAFTTYRAQSVGLTITIYLEKGCHFKSTLRNMVVLGPSIGFGSADEFCFRNFGYRMESLCHHCTLILRNASVDPSGFKYTTE